MTDDEIDQLCKQPSSYPAIDSSDWKTLNAEKKAEQVEIELNKGKRAKGCNGGKKKETTETTQNSQTWPRDGGTDRRDLPEDNAAEEEAQSDANSNTIYE